jgi:hypothetical protein
VSIQPEPTTLAFPVEVRFITRLRDGQLALSEDSVTYDPESWPIAVAALATDVRRRFGGRRCLVSNRSIEDADATRDEHVVLQSLGTRWIYLPPGLVSDALNNDVSKAELSFLRAGLMGWLRDFYLTATHEKVFVDKRGRKVVLKSDPHTGFSIEVHGGPPLEPRVEPSGEGQFDFDLLVDEPATLPVSRTITKIAYLALCVAIPDIALSPVLDDARRFIEHAREEDFRAYAEQFLPGAWPGFGLRVQVDRREAENATREVERVAIGLRLHHVLYNFVLAGPAEPPPDDGSLAYFSEVRPPGTSMRRLTFRFGAIQRTR